MKHLVSVSFGEVKDLAKTYAYLLNF